MLNLIKLTCVYLKGVNFCIVSLQCSISLFLLLHELLSEMADKRFLKVLSDNLLLVDLLMVVLLIQVNYLQCSLK